MGLSDPFSTTYEGSRQAGLSLGQGIQQAAGAIGSKLEERNKQQQTMNMLKQFGILKEDEPKLEDFQKDFEKQFKTKITNVTGMMGGPADTQTLEGIKNIYQVMGLTPPKSKGLVFNADAAKNIPSGVDISGGEISYKAPTSPMMGIYTTNPDGGVTQTGAVPKGSKILQPTSLEKSKQIIDRVRNSKKGDTDYETAKDLAFGKLTIDEFNKLIGGMGIETRDAAKAMFQKAKEINPDFNESIMENRQGQLKAGLVALGKQQSLSGQMVARVDRFADIALEYSKKVNRGNLPWLTNLEYEGVTKVLQDPNTTPDVKAFINSVQLLATDWARANTGQTGGAAVTDEARKFFKDFIKASDNPETFEAQVALAKRDTQQTYAGYTDEQKSLLQQYQEEFGGQDMGSQVTKAAGLSGKTITGTHKGKKVISNDGGKTWEYSK